MQDKREWGASTIPLHRLSTSIFFETASTWTQNNDSHSLFSNKIQWWQGAHNVNSKGIAEISLNLSWTDLYD